MSSNSEFTEYGFQHTQAPSQARTIAINISHLHGSDKRVGPLLGRIFAAQAETTALSRELVAAELATVEVEYEASRIAARTSRDKFQECKQLEIQYANNVANAQAKFDGDNRLAAAWRDEPVDVYASKSEIAARNATIAEHERKATDAEAELVKANQDQNLYYGDAENFTREYNAAQIRFAELDARHTQLQNALASLEAEQN